MLREALDAVDETVGFYVELKYPQILYVRTSNKLPTEQYLIFAWLFCSLVVLPFVLKNDNHWCGFELSNVIVRHV